MQQMNSAGLVVGVNPIPLNASQPLQSPIVRSPRMTKQEMNALGEQVTVVLKKSPRGVGAGVIIAQAATQVLRQGSRSPRRP